MVFELGFDIDDENPVSVTIVNPVFIVKNWGDSDVELKVDGKPWTELIRKGYEKSPDGTDLVLWLKMKTDRKVKFSLEPKD